MPGNLENVTFYANSSQRRFLCLQRIWKFCDGHICALSKERRQWRLNWKSQNANFVKSDKYFELAKGPFSWEDVCLHFSIKESRQIDLNQTVKGSDRTNIKLYVSLWDCICHRSMMKYEILNIWKVSNFYVRFRNCICHRANMKCEI